MLFTVFLISFLAGNVLSARILLAAMPQGRSHIGSFAPFMHKLMESTHSVSLHSTIYRPEMSFGMNDSFLLLSNETNPYHSKIFASHVWHHDFTFVDQYMPFAFGTSSCETVLRTRLTDFNRIIDSGWDVVLTDSLFTACGYAISWKANIPHVIMHSSDVESAQGSLRAYQRNYAILPPGFMSSQNLRADPAFFLDRVTGLIDWIGTIISINIMADSSMSKVVSSFVPDFSFKEHNRRASFAFTDMPDALYPPAPRTNDLFSYGGYCKPSAALPSDFESFVSVNSKGIIVVALGTIVNWNSAPKEKLEAFVQTLNNLTEYRIIWSYNGPHINVSEHIKLSNWIPQNELLDHNKTVLFISHGGLKSVKEAACSGTPSLFMPMFAEQIRNSWLAKNKGFGAILRKTEITTPYLLNAVHRILENSEYQTSANKLKSQLLDRVKSCLDEATFKMSKLMKHKGRMPDFFYSPGLQIDTFRTFNIDILIVIPFILFAVVVS